MWPRNQEVTNRGDSFYTLGDDNEYRHENRHLMAALRSGRFLNCYWPFENQPIRGQAYSINLKTVLR